MAGGEQLTEAQLMRTCGNLYVSIALESFATTAMSLIFAYLLLLVTNRGRLANPGKAAVNFITSNIAAFYNDVLGEVSHWQEMNKLPLERRFAMCRKANQAICTFQLVVGFLTVERWLHVNNVNGFRYLGYAVTCPPMHTELIVLIAPVVPCYKLQCYITYFITSVMLLGAYSASLLEGEVYHGSARSFLETWNGSELMLTNKGTAAAFGACVLSYLTFIQLPYLAFLYLRSGGVQAGLPHGYLRLLVIVGITWLAFPMWWCLSYEGMALIADTKANAVGFAVLNVISKGSFTLQMLSMVAWHRREKKRKECLGGQVPMNVGLFTADTKPIGPKSPPHPGAGGRRDTWVVEMLRPYDLEEGNEQWRNLEPSFRAFLVGRGVAPSLWNGMTPEQRQPHKETFQSTFELMLSDSAVQEPCKPWQQSLQPKSEAETVEEEENNSILEVSEVSLRDLAAERSPKQSASPPTTSWRSTESPKPPKAAGPPAVPALATQGLPPPHRNGAAAPAPPPPSGTHFPGGGLRVNQMITSLQGHKGRVQRILPGREVQIAMAGNRMETLSIDDLTMLKVVFLGMRGLRAADPSGDMTKLQLTAMIDGHPSTEVQSKVKQAGGSQLRFHEVLEVYGFTPGSFVGLRLWGEDAHGSSDQVLLGEARIESSKIVAGEFEGELQLKKDDGRRLQTYLSIMIVAANLPPAGGTAPASQQFQGGGLDAA